jgi:hypothetical protein
LIYKLKKKNIKSLGYFFSVIRENKHSVFYKFPKKLIPDTTLVTGKVIKNFFIKNGFYKKSISILGSGRSYAKKKFVIEKFYKKKINLLFCPEGIYPDCVALYNLASKVVDQNKDIGVSIRFHPEINIKKVLNDPKINLKNFKKITISNKQLDDDLKYSNIIIYSGSSMCFNGIFSGVIPVNYIYKANLKLDPLFQVNKLKSCNEKQLVNLIKRIQNKKNKLYFKKYMNKLLNYAENYYQKINKNEIISIIK